jgi:hypothetical protein
MKSAVLAERKSESEALADRIRSHNHGDVKCKPACDELNRMKSELKTLKEEIRMWFNMPADSETLF